MGVDYGMDINLENDLPNNWREFNKKFIPTYLDKNPDKTNVAVGLACGAIHRMSKQITEITVSRNIRILTSLDKFIRAHILGA